MNQLTSTDLLNRAKQANIATETTGRVLCVLLAEIKRTEAYKALGYDDFMEYAVSELKRSKGTVSKLTKVGEFLQENSINPDELEDTSYARLYLSINANKDKDPQYVLASAQTLTESELISTKQEQDAGEHEHQFINKCKLCGQLG